MNFIEDHQNKYFNNVGFVMSANVIWIINNYEDVIMSKQFIILK